MADRTHPAALLTCRERETHALIEFATQWAPYGGPSDDDLLVTFGISRHRFLHILWNLIAHDIPTQTQINVLTDTYRRPPNPKTHQTVPNPWGQN